MGTWLPDALQLHSMLQTQAFERFVRDAEAAADIGCRMAVQEHISSDSSDSATFFMRQSPISSFPHDHAPAIDRIADVSAPTSMAVKLRGITCAVTGYLTKYDFQLKCQGVNIT